MKVLFVNEAGVRELLPMETCIPLMREALATLARGDAVLPLRSMLRLPDGSGLLGLMPGYLGDAAELRPQGRDRSCPATTARRTTRTRAS